MIRIQPQTVLEIVLWVKIFATMFFWSFPLLLIPASVMKRAGVPQPTPVLLLRLLGAAFLSLLVGYLLGIYDLRRHQDVTHTVWVGIVSNGSACMLLVYYVYAGAWPDWAGSAPAVMWLSALLTGLIMMKLIVAGLIAGGTRGK